MQPRTILPAVIMAAALVAAACSGSEKPSEAPSASVPPPAAAPPTQSTELKQIQQKKSGDYVITLLNESGSLKQGANNLTLEFRRGEQLTDPGNVQVKPMMEMKGLGPMLANTNVTPSGTPGRYTITSDMAMAGQWKIKVTFNGGEAEFNVAAQ